jgi:UDPglucose 6-dehydrogenase
MKVVITFSTFDLSEWKEFRSTDFEEIKTQLKTPVTFDGRNQYNTFNLEEKGFEYYKIVKSK